jgi:two-component sensor histidine kinase
LGSKKGLWGAIILIFATVLLFVFGEKFGFKSSATPAFELRFVIAYAVVAIFAYAFEKTRENTQLRVIRQNTELNDRLSELELLKDELEKTNSVLDDRVKARTAELQQANAKLDTELREKDILLKEIHHRVKNNLQIISSLLYLQSQSLNDENSKALFEDSRNRILSMAMVHENLYQSKDIANVNMKDYIKTLTSALMHSYSNPDVYVELELIVDHLPVTIDKAIPLGLIVNELVSNALKYAFTDFHKKADSHLSTGQIPKITVALRQETCPGVKLVVADNGKGIPDDIDFRESPSLGLQLVNSLVNQIDGTVELSKDKGTQYKISFNIR